MAQAASPVCRPKPPVFQNGGNLLGIRVVSKGRKARIFILTKGKARL